MTDFSCSYVWCLAFVLVTWVQTSHHRVTCHTYGLPRSSDLFKSSHCPWFLFFVILILVTKRTRSLNSFIPHLYLYQRGVIYLLPLPVPLSPFRNFLPLLKYDFSFNLAFHTSELSDSTADGGKKKGRKTSIFIRISPFFSLTHPTDKIWFLLGKESICPSQGKWTPSCWAVCLF